MSLNHWPDPEAWLGTAEVAGLVPISKEKTPAVSKHTSTKKKAKSSVEKKSGCRDKKKAGAKKKAKAKPRVVLPSSIGCATPILGMDTVGAGIALEVTGLYAGNSAAGQHDSDEAAGAALPVAYCTV